MAARTDDEELHRQAREAALAPGGPLNLERWRTDTELRNLASRLRRRTVDGKLYFGYRTLKAYFAGHHGLHEPGEYGLPTITPTKLCEHITQMAQSAPPGNQNPPTRFRNWLRRSDQLEGLTPLDAAKRVHGLCLAALVPEKPAIAALLAHRGLSPQQIAPILGIRIGTAINQINGVHRILELQNKNRANGRR